VVARVVALWVFGILGATIFGGIVGHGLTHSEASSFIGAYGTQGVREGELGLIDSTRTAFVDNASRRDSGA
jgi:hypothetical protein